ncbi:hypothetical protein QLX08_009101 [Tetragonisca angustula]|uniref:Uncharacterized protein n=1 Tax=Tetragonisca angustula TaxID=166442 RepID=A0AAW0ZJC7_9HYME
MHDSLYNYVMRFDLRFVTCRIQSISQKRLECKSWRGHGTHAFDFGDSGATHWPGMRMSKATENFGVSVFWICQLGTVRWLFARGRVLTSASTLLTTMGKGDSRT